MDINLEEEAGNFKSTQVLEEAGEVAESEAGVQTGAERTVIRVTPQDQREHTLKEKTPVDR